MVKTIFRNTFLVGLSVLLLCALLFFGMQYTEVTEETLSFLKEEAVYVEKGVLLGGQHYLESLQGTERVTWLSEEGDVLYDSAPDGLESQKDCPEVASAMADGEGDALRAPEGGGDSILHYAFRIGDGTILRLSRPVSAVRYALLSVSPVMWVLVLVLLISGVLAFRAAKQIVSPINSLDLDAPDMSVYPELTPLLERIQEQKLTIQEEVAQREQLRREFSANVSHELKTPLTAISGFAELLAQGVVSQDKVREFATDICKESDHLMALIDDIIRISRLDEGAVGPEWEDVDLCALTSGILDKLQPAADRQQVSLRMVGSDVKVRGVTQLLEEMVYNLCDNAVKYNRPGGEVKVTIREEDGHAVLSVADNGIGIPKEHQKRVFERFYRVDKSHSKAVGGTGLGLSIVKHGAQYLGASLSLESESGLGTTVTLRFDQESQEGKEPLKEA